MQKRHKSLSFCMFFLLQFRDYILGAAEAYLLAPVKDVRAMLFCNTVQQWLCVVMLVVVYLCHDVIARLVQGNGVETCQDAVVGNQRLCRMAVAVAVYGHVVHDSDVYDACLTVC